MSGILNQTGAVSGILGTTVGTPTAPNIIQTVSASKTDTSSWTAVEAWTDTGVTATITPSATANKILIMWQLAHAVATSTDQVGIGLVRDSTLINVGHAGAGIRITAQSEGIYSGSISFTQSTISGMFVDSPSSIIAVTYKLQIQSASTAGTTVYVNRTYIDRTSTYYDGRTASNIILQEIKG